MNPWNLKGLILPSPIMIDLWEDMAIQIHSMKSKCSDDELTFQIDGDKIATRNIFQEHVMNIFAVDRDPNTRINFLIDVTKMILESRQMPGIL